MKQLNATTANYQSQTHHLPLSCKILWNNVVLGILFKPISCQSWNPKDLKDFETDNTAMCDCKLNLFSI